MATATAVKKDAEVRDLSEIPFSMEVLPLGEMVVDEYQRALNRPFLNRMNKNWKPSRVGTLTISRRSSGRLVIVDGRRRWTIMRGKPVRIKGEGVNIPDRGITEWACVVYDGLTKEEEALMFRDLQRDRQPVLTWEVFQSELIGGDADAKALNDAVESIGYKIGPVAEGKFPAVSALQTCYKKARRLVEQGKLTDPLVTLERALTIYRQAWRDRDVPSGWQISGMHEFLLRRPDIDDEKMVRRLKLVSPTDLNQRASYAMQAAGSTAKSPAYMREALGKTYASREKKA